MKRKNATVWFLTLTALATGLAACGGGGGQGGSEESSTSQANTVRRIRRETIPSAAVGTELDLDEYVSVEYRDGTTDKNFTLTPEDEGITITDHKVTSDTIGTFTVVITAGTMNVKVDINFVSEGVLKLTNSLAPLASDPHNFTVDAYLDYNQGSGSYSYTFTHYHKDDYSARFDPDNLDNDYNTVLAPLSDNNYYMGKVIEGENGGYDVKFSPGIISNAPYYYMLMGIAFDSGSITDSVMSGESVILGSSSFAQALIEGGLGFTYTMNDGSDIVWNSALFLGGVDSDGNDIYESMSFEVFCDYTYTTSTGQTVTEPSSVCIITLKNLGGTSLDYVEEALPNASYIPVPYTAEEISGGFATLAKDKNYTVTATFEQLDGAYGDVVDVQSGYDVMNLLYGASKVVITNTYTTEGVISKFEAEDLSWNEEGTSFTIGDLAQYSGWAAWSDGAKSWRSAYDSETSAFSGTTEIKDADEASTADVYGDYIDANGYSAAGVSAANVAATNWTDREEGTVITYAGDVGDNDGTTATNAFLGEVLDAVGPYVINDLSAEEGTILPSAFWCDTSAQPFTDGNYHASSLYSTWDSVAVDSSTGEIEMVATLYAPFGLDDYGGVAYMRMTVTVSDIGKTVNDFSKMPAAEEVTEPAA